MDKNALIKRLMKTFLMELESEVTNLNAALLEIEKTTDEHSRRESIQKVFRSAHSLKGAARSVGLDPIERVCHLFETLFTEIKQRECALTPESLSLCYSTVDYLSLASGILNRGEELGLDSTNKIIEKLETFIKTPFSEARTSNQPKVEPQIVEKAIPSTISPNTPRAKPSSPETSSFVRVTARKLDELIAETGEMFIQWQKMDRWQDNLTNLHHKLIELQLAIEDIGLPTQQLSKVRSQASGLMHSIERESFSFRKDRNAVFQAMKRIDQQVREIRMLPFSDACLGLDRSVRDIAIDQNKQIDLKIEGADVEMDRSILEQLRSPLLHLIRNAVDHGLETAEERTLSGKSPTGQIQIKTSVHASQVEIQVNDDGRGVNYEAIRNKAAEKGIPVPNQEKDLLNLLFLPGFSTAKIITELSGRGVGLDVLKTNIEDLRGTIEMESTPGLGAQFTIRVPLTLSTLRTVLVELGGHTYGIPTSNIVRLVRLESKQIRHILATDAIFFEGELLPLRALADVLALTTDSPSLPSATDQTCAIIVTTGKQRAAWIVDRYISEQELVVKNLGSRIKKLKVLSGATILPTGKIGLIVNVPELIRAQSGTKANVFQRVNTNISETTSKKHILLVEDSLTTRSLERSILEAAGYEVIEATDGEMAWKLLQATHVDLIVSDVEMPKMDGLQFTETVRASTKWSKIPIILVTSLSKDADKKRGMEVGASAYIVKGDLDQSGLLATVAQLL